MLKGQALADLGQRKDAQLCMKRAAQHAEDSDVELLVQLAQSQFAAGELAEARICLGRALREEPGNLAALAVQSEVDRKFVDFSHRNGVQAHTAGFEDVVIPPN